MTSKPCLCRKGVWVGNFSLGSRFKTWQLAYQVGSLFAILTCRWPHRVQRERDPQIGPQADLP